MSAQCEDPWMTDDPWTNVRGDLLPKNDGNAWVHWNSCTTSNRAPAQFANINLDVKSERLAMLEEDNYARERQRVEADKEEESSVQCFNGDGKWMLLVGKLEAGAWYRSILTYYHWISFASTCLGVIVAGFYALTKTAPH